MSKLRLREFNNNLSKITKYIKWQNWEFNLCLSGACIFKDLKHLLLYLKCNQIFSYLILLLPIRFGTTEGYSVEILFILKIYLKVNSDDFNKNRKSIMCDHI